MSSKNKIAVVGMACRYPGAENIDEFWKVLIEGRDTITHFTDMELEEYEYDYENLRQNPDYVRAKGIINDIDKFDAAFFGYTPKEAETLDPQYRVWLETVWHALENAGCDPFSYQGKIGVFAGGSMNTYLHNNVLRNPKAIEDYIRVRTPESFQAMLGNEVSFLPTKTAYKLNLRGPAINIQTACSTSLVAVAMSCNSLLNGESDMCVAGGVSILVPQETGYMYQEGAIASPDGVCRSFDKDAKGAVFSNGVGVVVLKRLDDAIRDKDIIYSVVTGWALNNDGSNKVSYGAPSIDGQSDVIKMAQSVAGVSPEDMGFIEAHGTATLLGDPVELTALSNAFKIKTDKKQYCGIGSVKSNIGHADAAAGIAGFIKASLAVFNKIIPPTIHYSEPNPFFDFEDSPFYVQDKVKQWSESKPMMAGVSSFGIGGTNVHVIIEEPPVTEKETSKPSEWPELVVLSAKSEKALERKKRDMAEFVKARPDMNLREVSYTLATGRSHMKFRSFMIASGIDDLTVSEGKYNDGKVDKFISRIAFMFPGQGAQYVSMGFGLYNSNTLFHEILDECFSVFKSETGEDLKMILFNSQDSKEAEARLADTEITQPALFIIEYALARVFMQLNIEPSYLIGHSIGEYTAACLAGVFDLKTALKIVIMRGKLMQKMPRGEMMALKTTRDILEEIKGNLFEIAAENATDFCTISFKPENKDSVKTLLEKKEIQYIPLNTSHAFHSSDFDPILNDFASYVSQFRLNPPKIQFISCLTGEFISDQQATSATYWAQQLRNTVLFRKGISTITDVDDVAFLEAGPNTHLSSLVKQHDKVVNKKAVIPSLGKPDHSDERDKIIASVGNLYNLGISLSFNSFVKGGKPDKVLLPSYPFEKTRCWIDFHLSGKNYLLPSDNASGTKTDYSQDDETSVDVDSTILTPSEKIEKKILNIWKLLFGMEEIKADDNFFDIGGHSLLALQILTRIKEDLHQNIALKTFLDNPTVSGLCSLINAESSQEEEEAELVHLTDLSHLKLSDNQSRLWIISKLDSQNPAYNVPFTYHLQGDLNFEVFSESINLLFQRHHIVFSVFREKNGIPYYTITPHKAAVELIDYSNDAAEECMDKIYSFIGADSRKCFDIENGPLYRVFLLKQSETSYFFHVNIHHLIFDGWSWGVFVRDLNKIYNNLIANEEVTLKDLPIQYYDYANWQESSMKKSSEKELTNFWVDYLKDCPPVTSFPYDQVRGKISTGCGEKVHIKISEEATAKLRSICKNENSTLFSVLLTAYGILLQKYSGDTDLCLGTPVANRPASKLEDVFGMFINTIAIRVKIDTDGSFGKLVSDVRNSTIEAISHQELPFEKVVEAINPVRTFNMNPLFQICFAWQSNLSIPLNIKGVKGERFTANEGVSPFDMTLYMWEREDFIEGEIEYKNEILLRSTILRLKEHFLSLINVLTENIDKPINSISLVSNEEKRMICEVNNNATNYPREKTIAQVFEDVVVKFPNNSAVTYNGKTYTYKKLNEKANQLARTLRESGVRENTPVGILADKSYGMIVAFLAILKAGGCYTPLDPEFPDQRINFIIKDCGINIILTQSNYMNVATSDAIKINMDKEKNYSINKTNLINTSSPESFAYMLYTSGTTGVPKGTPAPQRGVIRLVCNTNYIDYTSDDRILWIGAAVFDSSSMEIWGALLNGGALFIVDKETILTPSLLKEAVEKNKITILVMTAALFTHIAESGGDLLKRIRYLVVGGDELSASHANKVRKDNPDLILLNAYGPTENSTTSTCFRVDKNYERNIPIGKPISNSKAYIFDKHLNFQPIGVVGELYVAGDGLSKGYINREDLNRSCFIENPYVPGEIIYKTGDRARWLPDCNIEFLGRTDNQMKVRGFRVELGEIESVLSSIDGIVEAIIKPVKVKEGDYKLVAFLNVLPTFKMDSKVIIGKIKDKLPAYMMPSSFKFMNSFPRTINGKIDRKAPCFNNIDLLGFENKYVGSYTPTEKIIYGIWRDILKASDISLTDNFFEIGGNSLLAISAMSKTEAAFNTEFGLRVFFDSPRIKDLAEIIDINVRDRSVKTKASMKDQIISGEI